LDSLYTACDRIAVLGNGKIIAAGTMADMQASQHPWLRAYFHGKRARAVVGETHDSPRRQFESAADLASSVLRVGG
ncbi:MAG TPA: hypothetical protein VMM15_22885, partial [Bradyrhizobium sp.]|nr:hypothetical protein [Bradyrhizobium sp.]